MVNFCGGSRSSPTLPVARGLQLAAAWVLEMVKAGVRALAQTNPEREGGPDVPTAKDADS